MQPSLLLSSLLASTAVAGVVKRQSECPRDDPAILAVRAAVRPAVAFCKWWVGGSPRFYSALGDISLEDLNSACACIAVTPSLGRPTLMPPAQRLPPVSQPARRNNVLIRNTIADVDSFCAFWYFARGRATTPFGAFNSRRLYNVCLPFVAVNGVPPPPIGRPASTTTSASTTSDSTTSELTTSTGSTDPSTTESTSTTTSVDLTTTTTVDPTTTESTNGTTTSTSSTSSDTTTTTTTTTTTRRITTTTAPTAGPTPDASIPSCETGSEQLGPFLRSDRSFRLDCARSYTGVPITGVAAIATDLDQCLEACAGQETCTFANFDISGEADAASTCTLFRQANEDDTPAANIASFVREGLGNALSCPLDNEFVTQGSNGEGYTLRCADAVSGGTEIGTVASLSAQACRDSCAGSPGCTASTFSSTASTCTLRRRAEVTGDGDILAFVAVAETVLECPFDNNLATEDANGQTYTLRCTSALSTSEALTAPDTAPALTDLQSCQQRCAATPGCTFASYAAGALGVDPACILQRGGAISQDDASEIPIFERSVQTLACSADSGYASITNGVTYTLSCGGTLTPEFIIPSSAAATAATTLDACLAACVASPRCNFASFSGTTCNLLRSGTLAPGTDATLAAFTATTGSGVTVAPRVGALSCSTATSTVTNDDDIFRLATTPARLTINCDGQTFADSTSTETTTAPASANACAETCATQVTCVAAQFTAAVNAAENVCLIITSGGTSTFTVLSGEILFVRST